VAAPASDPAQGDPYPLSSQPLPGPENLTALWFTKKTATAAILDESSQIPRQSA
jgi:hypothetical protein